MFFVFGPCFVIQYLVSFLVFQSSYCERESWLLYFNSIPAVLWLLVRLYVIMFCVSSSQCHGLIDLQCMIVVFPGQAHFFRKMIR